MAGEWQPTTLGAEADLLTGFPFKSERYTDANDGVRLVRGDNIVQGDTLNGAHLVELCDWQPHPGGCFRRVWTHALIPDGDRDLFWAEWVQDAEPTHFSTMLPTQSKKSAGRKARTSR